MPGMSSWSSSIEPKSKSILVTTPFALPNFTFDCGVADEFTDGDGVVVTGVGDCMGEEEAEGFGAGVCNGVTFAFCVTGGVFVCEFEFDGSDDSPQEPVKKSAMEIKTKNLF